MTDQTAIEWLIEEIHKNMGVWIPPHIQEEAKQLEEEKLKERFDEGYDEGFRDGIKMTTPNS